MEKPADLDVAMVMGMGFPAFRGGLIFWADLVGAGGLVGALVGCWGRWWAAAAENSLCCVACSALRCVQLATLLL